MSQGFGFGGWPGAGEEAGGRRAGPRDLFFRAPPPASITQAEAFPVGFEDVDTVGEAVEQSSGEPFGSKHLDPVLKGQIGGDDDAGAFVSAADDIEEQFGTGLGERDVAEFVEDEQIESFELLHEALQFVAVALLEHMGHQGGYPEEAHPPALGAGGETQGGGQVGLTGTGVTEKEHVFALIDILPAHEFAHERFVDRGLGFESEALEGFEHREAGVFDPSLGGPLFAFNELAFDQLQQEGGIVEPVPGTGCGHRRPLAQDGGQLQFLEVMLQQQLVFFFLHSAAVWLLSRSL